MASSAPRPFVTLTYAQSLDGSLAAQPGVPLALSGPESRRFTHQLRARHDAILVGIETVLADDPQLNVRLVAGADPRPVLLDSHLRCPTRARCLAAARHPIIATSEAAALDRQRELEAVGAMIVRLPSRAGQIDLIALLAQLDAQGIQTLMVEGGARVITSFLQARLVDRVTLTLTPILVGGVRAITNLVSAPPQFPRLRQATIETLGPDWIVSGEIEWDAL